MALDTPPGSSPEDQVDRRLGHLLEERDFLRERLTEVPVDPARQLARARRALATALESLDQATSVQRKPRPGDVARAAAWETRAADLRQQVAELEAEQQLRLEWERTHVALIERADRVEAQLEQLRESTGYQPLEHELG